MYVRPLYLFISPRRSSILFLMIIQLSKLHFTLRQLVGYIRFPGDRKYKFRQRAGAILTRWEALFLADISRPDSTLCWAIKGAKAIVFIPGDHRE